MVSMTLARFESYSLRKVFANCVIIHTSGLILEKHILLTMIQLRSVLNESGLIMIRLHSCMVEIRHIGNI